MLMHMQVASSVERPAADGEESEKANGHAEVKTKIQLYKYKYSNTKKTIYHLMYKNENVCICVDKFYIFFVTQFSFMLQVEAPSSKEEDLAVALQEWREKCDRIHLESEKM